MLIELPIANFGINMSTKEKDYLLHNTKRTASKRTSYKHGTFFFFNPSNLPYMGQSLLVCNACSFASR
jgi:hypothetical protein